MSPIEADVAKKLTRALRKAGYDIDRLVLEAVRAKAFEQGSGSPMSDSDKGMIAIAAGVVKGVSDRRGLDESFWIEYDLRYFGKAIGDDAMIRRADRIRQHAVEEHERELREKKGPKAPLLTCHACRVQVPGPHTGDGVRMTGPCGADEVYL